jgi:hypothetical protein
MVDHEIEALVDKTNDSATVESGTHDDGTHSTSTNHVRDQEPAIDGRATAENAWDENQLNGEVLNIISAYAEDVHSPSRTPTPDNLHPKVDDEANQLSSATRRQWKRAWMRWGPPSTAPQRATEIRQTTI